MNTMTPELFQELWIPSRPLAGDTKEASYKMSREEALKHRFIQTHPRSAMNLIILDFDMEQSDWYVKSLVHDTGVLPEPNWVTVNPETEGCHAGFFTEGTAGTDAGQAFFNFLFEGLKEVSGSDMGYRGDKTRNPFHSRQMTTWGTDHIYTYSELKEFVTQKAPHFYTKKNALPEVGRHNILFNKLSAWSYREWRKPAFEMRIQMEAERLNMEFPEALPSSHVQATIRSIQSFISRNFSEEQFSEIQRARVNRRWQGQGAQTASELLMMVEAGMTPREISEALGSNLAATRKAIQRAKKFLN